MVRRTSVLSHRVLPRAACRRVAAELSKLNVMEETARIMEETQRRVPRVAAILAALALAGCASLDVKPLPEPIREPKPLPEAVSDAAAAPEDDAGTKVSSTPGVVIQRTVAEGIADRLGEDLTGPPITVSFHDVPIVTFINEVFAERLGMSFTLSSGLSGKTDLVTLRLTEPVSPSQLFATARRVLRDYGVDLRETDGILTFLAEQEIASSDIPLLISGRALPEVPPTHRIAYQLVPMHVMASRAAVAFLRQAFAGRGLQITDDPGRNAILLLRGTVESLVRAVDMIEVLDQPLLRGRFGLVIEPSFMAVSELATDLGAVLEAEGYEARINDPVGSIILLPLQGVNKLVAFASDQATLNHVEEWARTLDARKEATVENAVFTYEAQNTQAESMRETLDSILQTTVQDFSEQAEPGAGVQAAAGIGRIVVDENRNMLLFRGSGKEWAELRAVIDQLDRPVPSVLIEVLIAEITLRDEQESGIEFLFRSGIGSDRTVAGGTLDALGVQNKALSLTLDSAGMTRAVLNAFYEDNRVALRSSARLMVKSGESGTFDAGNEIPTITQLSDSGVQAGGYHQRAAAGDLSQNRRHAADRARSCRPTAWSI